MRIISKFRDYYDGVQTGEKDDLIYVRNETIIDDKELVKEFKLLNRDESWSRRENGPLAEEMRALSIRSGNVRSIRVIFRGTLYRGVKFQTDAVAPKQIERFYWDLESYMVDWTPEKRKKYWWHTPARMEEWFAPTDNERTLNFCVKHSTPILLLELVDRKYLVKKDAKLADIQFYKKFGAAQAFQEISMFLGGVLARNEDPEPLADKYRIAAHGMDATSFRRGPTKIHR